MTSHFPLDDDENHLRFVFDDAVVLLPVRGSMTFAEVARICEVAIDTCHRRVLAIDITLPLAAARPAPRSTMALASTAVVAISRQVGGAHHAGAHPSV